MNNVQPTDNNNNVILGQYNEAQQTFKDGEPVIPQYDILGNKKYTLATAIAGEDLTNNVLGVQQKPVVSGTYSGVAFTNYGAATKANVKASAAQIKAIHAQNENSAIRYLQIFNLAASPTDDSSVPIFSFAIPAGTANNPGICEKGADFFGEGGYYLSNGLSWGISVDPDVFDETGVTVGEHQINGLYI